MQNLMQAPVPSMDPKVVRVAGGEPGEYYVLGQTWQVGTRYSLLKVLGTGSFSAVCSALDHATGERVALKRIGDVLGSQENAKRVLREVCILKRLQHPNVVQLLDVFLKPSPTGRYVYRGGKLVATSLDIFLVTEYADLGDLFNLRGQLSEEEARSIMWQLLGAIKYTHDLHVWHRDIKSANVLLLVSEGRRIAKLADFGSARSAVTEAHTALSGGTGSARKAPRISDAGGWVQGQAPGSPQLGGRERGGEGSAAGAAWKDGPGTARAGWMAQLGGSLDSKVEDVQVRLAGAGAGFLPPLTRMVSTPCYRAPEVVMCRGGYSSAIDM